ncbi:MAG: hypothetical protein U5K74_11820 [Gemmatimonadaceae bacterium]|nr:hypothetical protein [Gemmatimonadaceae bacterium]
MRASLITVAGAATVAWLAFQRVPLVTTAADVSPDDVRRARRLMVRHDPRRGTAGQVRTVSLSQQDATLLTQYAASRWRRARTRVVLRAGGAGVQVSVVMPRNPLGAWLNVDADLRDADGIPDIRRMRVGRVPVPPFLADAGLRWGLARAGADAALTVARDMVQRTTFSPESVHVVYAWRADAVGRVRDMLVAPDEVARMAAYQARLASFIASTPEGAPLTLPQLLTPMLALAAERSGDDAAEAENRAALATLTLYVTGRSLGRWLRQAATWPTVPRRRVTLSGREDLTKHFLVSAIVAAEADRTLADAVGLTKEVDDSRGGTGFSFVDLAADRAGTRFGELAVGSPEDLQSAVADGIEERDIMPDVTGLPESMPESQFIARFGGVGAPAYAAMVQRIESRIAALPLLR